MYLQECLLRRSNVVACWIHEIANRRCGLPGVKRAVIARRQEAGIFLGTYLARDASNKIRDELKPYDVIPDEDELMSDSNKTIIRAMVAAA